MTAGRILLVLAAVSLASCSARTNQATEPQPTPPPRLERQPTMAVEELPPSAQEMLRQALDGCNSGSNYRRDARPAVGWASEKVRNAYTSARSAKNPAVEVGETLRITNTVINVIEAKCLAKPSFFATIKGKTKALREAIAKYDLLLAKSGALVAEIIDSYRPENLVPRHLEELRANALIFLSKAERCRLYIVRECEAALTYRRFFDTDVGRTKQLLEKFYPKNRRFWDHLKESIRIRNKAQAMIAQ